MAVKEAAHHGLRHGAAADEGQSLSGERHGAKYAEVRGAGQVAGSVPASLGFGLTALIVSRREVERR